jgi:16S rRNA (adenine1518-N6/adenine1519-N6)-dimethyltransferase
MHGDFPDYNSGPALRAYLEKRGLGIRKYWGQHFLINPSARRAVAEALEMEKAGSVWEIGSGMGCMTKELLQAGGRVTAFEVDPGFCAILEGLFASFSGFTLVKGDVLKTWKSCGGGSPYLLGNLPYTVAAALLGDLIEGGRFFTRMSVTVQKEVARRMTALPGSADYSSLSVLCASAYTVRIVMTLKGASFYPPPRVESAVVCFERREDFPAPAPLFFPLVRALFASRRKTIVNNLEHFLGCSCIMDGVPRTAVPEAAAAALEQSGVRGGERAEKLPPEAFAALTAALTPFVKEKKSDEHG